MSSFIKSMATTAGRLSLRLMGRSRIAVMTFHRVGSGYPIQTDHIRHHMEFLARHFEMVSPSQLLKASSSRPMAMVTIDDSHRDIYECIYPVALSLKIPITICVPTDFFLRNQWLWFDQVAWMHEHCPAGKEVRLDGRRLQFSDAQALAQIKRHLKQLLPFQRTELLKRLAAETGCVLPPVPTDGYEAVTHDQMREMLASGYMEICAHAASHTIATVLPDADFREELARCKAELQAFSGREIPCFCYPNGVIGDFSEHTTRAVQDTGFKMAFTSVVGNNDQATTDPFLIRRIHATADLAAFERNISPLGDVRQRLLQSSSFQ